MNIKELNVNDYYFHSIIHGAKKAFDVVYGVIDKKAILPPRQISNCSRIGCNSNDEVCLSSVTNFKGNTENYRSCFDIYLPRLLTFVIDKEFSVKHYVRKPPLLSTSAVFKMVEKGNNKYTNLYDEHRTKGSVPFKFIKGLSIPYNDIINNPMVYLTFIDEMSQVEFYNGYMFEQAINLYNKKFMETGMRKRIEFMEKYIYALEELISSENIDLPIYFYEHDGNERKLVLK